MVFLCVYLRECLCDLIWKFLLFSMPCCCPSLQYIHIISTIVTFKFCVCLFFFQFFLCASFFMQLTYFSFWFYVPLKHFCHFLYSFCYCCSCKYLFFLIFAYSITLFVCLMLLTDIPLRHVRYGKYSVFG